MSISPLWTPRLAPGLADWLARAGRRLGSALLPQDCFLCGAVSGDALLCRACGNDLPRLPALRCPACALPTPRGETCGACLKRPPHFDATLSCFSYDFPVDRLIQALKYRRSLVVSDYLALALLEAAPMPPMPAMQAALLLALPLSAQRLRQRGFNQALEIARPLAKCLGLPLLIDGYKRVIDTAPQTSLPWQERQKNIQGAFECALDLSGKTIIVIDDVMTTGATLNEFARTLKKHGAANVINWVAARTLRH
ncbi:MAG: ComF family protein [Proteobacteria bacterium]|nr:ComF family protein [Pseudomonadota bacterium]